MNRFAFTLIGLVFALSPAKAEEISITTTRGLGADRPFTIAYPEFLREGPGPADTAVFLQHPDAPFQVELKIGPAAPDTDADAAAARFSTDAVLAEERRTYPDFAVERQAVVRLPAGPAFIYLATLTSRAPGAERLRLVHAELYDQGRRYELRSYVGVEIFEDARELIGFILANFSPRTDGRCCVDPIELP